MRTIGPYAKIGIIAASLSLTNCSSKSSKGGDESQEEAVLIPISGQQTNQNSTSHGMGIPAVLSPVSIQDPQSGILIKKDDAADSVELYKIEIVQPMEVLVSQNQNHTTLTAASNSAQIAIKDTIGKPVAVAIPMLPSASTQSFGLTSANSDFRVIAITGETDSMTLTVKPVEIASDKFTFEISKSGIFQVFRWPAGIDADGSDVTMNSRADGSFSLTIQTETKPSLALREDENNTDIVGPKETPEEVEDIPTLVEIMKDLSDESTDVIGHLPSDEMIPSETEHDIAASEDSSQEVVTYSDPTETSNDETSSYFYTKTVTNSDEFELQTYRNNADQIIKTTSWYGSVQSFQIPKSLTASSIGVSAKVSEVVLSFTSSSCTYLNSPNRPKSFLWVSCDNSELIAGGLVESIEVSLRITENLTGPDATIVVSVFDLMSLDSILNFDAKYEKGSGFVQRQEEIKDLSDQIAKGEADYLFAMISLDASLASLNEQELTEKLALEAIQAAERLNQVTIIEQKEELLATLTGAPANTAAKELRTLRSQYNTLIRNQTKSLNALIASYTKARKAIATTGVALTKQKDSLIAKLDTRRNKALAQIESGELKVNQFQQGIQTAKETFGKVLYELGIAHEMALTALKTDWDILAAEFSSKIADAQTALFNHETLENNGEKAWVSVKNQLQKNLTTLEKKQISAENQYLKKVNSAERNFKNKQDSAENKLRQTIESLTIKIRATHGELVTPPENSSSGS